MSLDFVRILTNKRSMQAFMRRFTIEQLEEISTKFEEVTGDLKAEKSREEAKVAAREALLAEYAEKMAADGLSIQDLLNAAGAIKPEQEGYKSDGRRVVPQKYEFMTDEGDIKTWSGRGRPPREIKRALEQGESLEDFLIKH